MANTYIAIATTTVGSGGASTIDFQSIPATYTDLLVKLSLRTNTSFAGNGYYYTWTFNNTSANQTRRQIQGDGANAGSGNFTSFALYCNPSDYTTSTFATSEIYVPNYAGSNYKSASAESTTENNATTSYAGLFAFLWSDTSAVNRITFTPGAGNFVQYSTATLYGIKKD